jgi:hypothetical protein
MVLTRRLLPFLGCAFESEGTENCIGAPRFQPLTHPAGLPLTPPRTNYALPQAKQGWTQDDGGAGSPQRSAKGECVRY